MPAKREQLPPIKAKTSPVREFPTRLGFAVRISQDGAVWRMNNGQEILASGSQSAAWLREHALGNSFELRAAISYCETLGIESERVADWIKQKRKRQLEQKGLPQAKRDKQLRHARRKAGREA